MDQGFSNLNRIKVKDFDMTDIETQNPDKAKHWGNLRLNL